MGVNNKLIRSITGSVVQQYNRASYRFQKNDGSIIRFNTALSTDNLGDHIIMKYCTDILNELFPEGDFIDVSTHVLPTAEQETQVRRTKLKFLCGTNMMTSHVEEYWYWILPDGLRRKLAYRNVILLGVGWKKYEDPCSDYTRMIYQCLLAPDVIHSVRDQYSEDMLKKAGIKNVINTGCPTMWKLTPEFCRTIPTEKAKSVITTITDYRRDPERDTRMLQILGRNYEHVYLWLQGKDDAEYLSTLAVPGNLTTIPSSLETYEQMLKSGEVDYVGTRLHAGIHALNHHVRSLIIAVDNRAIEIAKDTNLPVVPREAMSEILEDLVQSERSTEIRIKQNNIMKFINQF